MKTGTMLSAAILLATNAHAGQYDKAGQPYILHALKVLHYTKSDDEELQCIAVLHDVVEDCDVSWEDLVRAGMSDRVIRGVMALTKQRGQSYAEYKNLVFANADAMRVKLADLRHNSDIRRLKGISERDRARILRYHEFAFEIQQRLNNGIKA
jgi:GTP diphosphokinase / guanosine-3',5'-bis(diphosphate) 3'-diphosphatase